MNADDARARIEEYIEVLESRFPGCVLSLGNDPSPATLYTGDVRALLAELDRARALLLRWWAYSDLLPDETPENGFTLPSETHAFLAGSVQEEAQT